MPEISLVQDVEARTAYLERAQRAAMCLNNPAGKALLEDFEARYAHRSPWVSGPDGDRETARAIGKMELIWELMTLVHVGTYGMRDEPNTPSENPYA